MSLALPGSPRVPREAELIALAVRGDKDAVRALVRQHNQRLFRIARSVLRDDGDAEDAVQDAYVRAIPALATFRGDSSLATWLSRIVLNESFQKLRRKRREPQSVAEPEAAMDAEIIPFPAAASQSADPERKVAQREVFVLVERAIDNLPDDFRLVLVARTIEGMSVEETAELLGLKPETVNTRLFRARALLRTALSAHVTSLFTDAFPFDGWRCKRMADAVIARLGLQA